MSDHEGLRVVVVGNPDKRVVWQYTCGERVGGEHLLATPTDLSRALHNDSGTEPCRHIVIIVDAGSLLQPLRGAAQAALSSVKHTWCALQSVLTAGSFCVLVVPDPSIPDSDADAMEALRLSRAQSKRAAWRDAPGYLTLDASTPKWDVLAAIGVPRPQVVSNLVCMYTYTHTSYGYDIFPREEAKEVGLQLSFTKYSAIFLAVDAGAAGYPRLRVSDPDPTPAERGRLFADVAARYKTEVSRLRAPRVHIVLYTGGVRPEERVPASKVTEARKMLEDAGVPPDRIHLHHPDVYLECARAMGIPCRPCREPMRPTGCTFM